MSLPVPTEQTHLSHPKYRADIDGLRAIAVLSVVSFHAFPDWIKGGFVGVDIFFVISGFLISSIILGSLSKGTFSFAEFYARRIKRIFPALIVVMAACYVFGWFDLLPKEYAQLGQHIAGGAGFISNFLLWQEVGYFDNLAETKPLLHLWSLGIEEQYYIVWPLLLFLAYRWRFNFLILATLILAVSFIANVSLIHDHPVLVFYSPFTRFWELLIGSILAYLVSQKQCLWTVGAHKLYAVIGTTPNPNWVRNTQSLLGAILIGLAVLLVNKKMVFPGWWALLPTVGAYLIIAAGQHAWLNRTLLSHRLLVWFGLISYPLYLWHWPLLSFARITEAATPSISIRLGAIALAILLAWLTYRLVEHPMRFGKQWEMAKILTLSLLMVALAAIGYGTFAQDGLNQRLLSQRWLGTASKYEQHSSWRDWSRCATHGLPREQCFTYNPKKLPSVALLGDSHADRIRNAIKDIYTPLGKNIIAKTRGGCSRFADLSTDNYYNLCNNFWNFALADVVASTSIETVILATYATNIIHGGKLISQAAPRNNRDGNKATLKLSAAKYKSAMYFTLGSLLLANKQVIVIVDIPELLFEPQECVAIRPYYLPGHQFREPCSIPRKVFDERTKIYHQIIAQVRADFPTVKFIDAYEYFCDEKSCHALIDGTLLYDDDNHLNKAGELYFAKKSAKQFLE